MIQKVFSSADFSIYIWNQYKINRHNSKIIEGFVIKKDKQVISFRVTSGKVETTIVSESKDKTLELALATLKVNGWRVDSKTVCYSFEELFDSLEKKASLSRVKSEFNKYISNLTNNI